MFIVQRLYIKDFIKIMLLISIGLSVIFSLLDLASKMDEFMPGKTSAAVLALYTFLNTPKFFIYLLPMSVLVCSLYTFSQAFRRGEITAIKTAGGRLRRLYLPFIMTGFLLSLLAFATSEFIVPDFSKRSADIRNILTAKTGSFTFSEGGLWLKSKDGSIVKIDLYNVEENAAKGLDIFVFGKDFLKEKLTAEKASWNGNTWVLENINRYEIETGRIEKIKTMDYSGLESPDIFSEDLKKPDEMGISELYRYVKRLKNAGFINSKLIVDLNSKISFPLINIFMMLIGISLSSGHRLGGGLFSAGLGLLISLAYWFGYTFMLSLGYSGLIHPAISAWIIPFIFGALAVRLFMKIPE
jgi:LPS export ABC transporter permease LptG